MTKSKNWAVVIPMANEEPDFYPFVTKIKSVLDQLNSGTAYFIVDKVSIDRTLELCQSLATEDSRFKVVWAPENKNVVDAYLRGYREALSKGHDYIIEMDAGLSHDPSAIPTFLQALDEGYECVFGSRFIKGGSMDDSPFFRRFLSKGGTFLANFLLGTRMKDMTSGFIGFHASVVRTFLSYRMLSTAHFYQTELRYLVRERKTLEIPIHYKAPSPRVSNKAIYNSFSVLFHYFTRRLKLQSVQL